MVWHNESALIESLYDAVLALRRETKDAVNDA
jgi:hypothetical protein